jgi:hypothetical protein
MQSFGNKGRSRLRTYQSNVNWIECSGGAPDNVLSGGWIYLQREGHLLFREPRLSPKSQG